MDIKKDNAMYMQIAQIAAGRSYAKRLQVGCVIVKNNSIKPFQSRPFGGLSGKSDS